MDLWDTSKRSTVDDEVKLGAKSQKDESIWNNNSQPGFNLRETNFQKNNQGTPAYSDFLPIPINTESWEENPIKPVYDDPRNKTKSQEFNSSKLPRNIAESWGSDDQSFFKTSHYTLGNELAESLNHIKEDNICQSNQIKHKNLNIIEAEAVQNEFQKIWGDPKLLNKSIKAPENIWSYDTTGGKINKLTEDPWKLINSNEINDSDLWKDTNKEIKSSFSQIENNSKNSFENMVTGPWEKNNSNKEIYFDPWRTNHKEIKNSVTGNSNDINKELWDLNSKNKQNNSDPWKNINKERLNLLSQKSGPKRDEINKEASESNFNAPRITGTNDIPIGKRLKIFDSDEPFEINKNMINLKNNNDTRSFESSNSNQTSNEIEKDQKCKEKEKDYISDSRIILEKHFKETYERVLEMTCQVLVGPFKDRKITSNQHYIISKSVAMILTFYYPVLFYNLENEDKNNVFFLVECYVKETLKEKNVAPKEEWFVNKTM